MQQEELKYPEHEKLILVQDQSQSIGEFLEWLTNEKGLSFCSFDEGGVNEAYYSNQELLAEYFGIDLYKIEQEKKQMLKEIRKLNETIF